LLGATTFEIHAQLSNKEHDCSRGICSINLSGASFGDEGFLEFLQVQAVIAGVPCNASCFEIAQAVAVENLTEAADLSRWPGLPGYQLFLHDRREPRGNRAN
jgi:EAL domain-containing protein (putative c-di-GMP-specific phosphodiesterase class I)